jgi:hypothetical protein
MTRMTSNEDARRASGTLRHAKVPRRYFPLPPHFTSNPLAAAYMMKHFKMRIHTGGGDTCDFRADFSGDQWCNRRIDNVVLYLKHECQRSHRQTSPRKQGQIDGTIHHAKFSQKVFLRENRQMAFEFLTNIVDCQGVWKTSTKKRGSR